MAWTATITKKEWVDGILYVTFSYTDGTRTVTERHRVGGVVPEEWVQLTADARVKALEAVDAMSSLSTGTVAKPTTPDAGLAEFRQMLRKLDIVSKLVSMKVVDATDAKVVAFVNNLKTALGTYWDNI